MKYAFKNLFRRGWRTVLALLAIAIGIAAAIVLISMSHGVLEGIYDILNALPGEVIVIRNHSAALDDSIIALEYRDSIGAIDGVTWTEPMLFKIQNMPIGDQRLMPDALAQAIGRNQENPSVLVPVFGYWPGGQAMATLEVEGEGFSGPADANEVIIGDDMARRMLQATGVQDLPDRISVPGGVGWEVRGTFHTSDPLREVSLAMPFETAQTFVGEEGNTSCLLIGLDDGTDPEEVAQAIMALDPARLEALKPEDYLKRFTPDLDRVHVFTFLISLVAAIAGAMGVFITMVVNVQDRTREIGLLMAVGWSRFRILRCIVLEGLMLSMIGGLLSFPIAIATLEPMPFLIRFNPIPQGYEPVVFGLGFLLAVGLGLLGTFLPAIWAARLSPTEAMRYE